MIEGKGEQGSIEWRKEKLGVPSASQFHRLVTPKGVLSQSQTSAKYRAELHAEWLFGEPGDAGRSGFMDRGKEMEPEARAYYAFKKAVDVKQVGFCRTDDKRYGCSPDGLVGKVGGVEIKCKGGANHINALLNYRPTDAYPQCMGALLVLDRDWWDRLFWHPDIKEVTLRFNRDEPYIKTLSDALDEFCDMIAEERDRLISMGCKSVDLKAKGLKCQMRIPDGRYCLSGVDVEEQDGLLMCAKCREVIARGPLGPSERMAG